jgi:TatD DNase family protein
MLIDTHCHLNFKAFKGKVDQVIKSALQAGVKKIIVPGADLQSSQRAVVLAQKYDQVYAAIGVHPHHCKTKEQPVLDQVETRSGKEKIKDKLRILAKNKKVVAIGECGLDYYQYQQTKYQDYKIDEEFKKTQRGIFKMQIELISELSLPLIIHNRQASEDIIEILENCKLKIENLQGVFHCFEGDQNILDWVRQHDFYLGITGNVTYNHKLQKAVKSIPLKRLVLETDAPWLTPEPLRSQKKWPNKPENVKIIAQWIASLKGDSFLNVAGETSNNATKLFNLK